MRNILLIAILAFLIYGCKSKTQNFQMIDYSCYSDPARIYSIKILNDGRTILYSYNKEWNSKYYYDLNLDNAMLDSINKLSGLILNSKFDSTYFLECTRCLTYCLIIKTNKRIFKVTYDGRLFSDKSLVLLDRLSKNIYLIVQNKKATIDSIFRFESWSNHLLPPRPSFDSCDYDNRGKEYLQNYH